MVIHKQVLEVTDVQRFDIEGLTEILSVGVQNGLMVMWFMRDPERMLIHNVTVRIYGTGNVFMDKETRGMDFKGTHLMAGGQLVWHVWTSRVV